ncbi:MAG: peptidase MA family metallohydrolase [Armatimonadetes bacterium]|nr:peptidase MA family metallohydrolase [Armatimonadota bacterium]
MNHLSRRKSLEHPGQGNFVARAVYRRSSILAILVLILLLGKVFGVWSTVGTAETRTRPKPKTETGLTATMRTRYFIVHYDPKDPYLAKLMAEAAEDELKRISRDLGYQLYPNENKHKVFYEPFSLYVYPTHTGFIKAGGLETNKFTVGTATAGENKISVDASGALELPERILAHEITHAVVFRILGPAAARLPLWMHEGLALYYDSFPHLTKHSEDGEPGTEDDPLVATAVAEGTLIPLSKLTSSFPESLSDLAYVQSASAVRFFISRYGPKAPKKLLAAMARTQSFDKAMLEVTGQTSEAFTNEWASHVTRRYWMLRVTRIVAAIISVSMAFLAVVAFLVRRKQKIESAKKWEDEELERRYRGYPWRPGDE